MFKMQRIVSKVTQSLVEGHCAKHQTLAQNSNERPDRKDDTVYLACQLLSLVVHLFSARCTVGIPVCHAINELITYLIGSNSKFQDVPWSRSSAFQCLGLASRSQQRPSIAKFRGASSGYSEGLGGFSPLLPFQAPRNSMSPLIESIKCYFNA